MTAQEFNEGDLVFAQLSRLDPALEGQHGVIRGVATTGVAVLGPTYIVELDVPGYPYSCIAVPALFLKAA
jgi:hypothetical protein